MRWALLWRYTSLAWGRQSQKLQLGLLGQLTVNVPERAIDPDHQHFFGQARTDVLSYLQRRHRLQVLFDASVHENDHWHCNPSKI